MKRRTVLRNGSTRDIGSGVMPAQAAGRFGVAAALDRPEGRSLARLRQAKSDEAADRSVRRPPPTYFGSFKGKNEAALLSRRKSSSRSRIGALLGAGPLRGKSLR